MSTEPSAQAILDHAYLPVRARILDIAATFDRLQRAGGSRAGEERLQQLRSAVELLLDEHQGRAERVQLLFSRPYDPRWRESL